MTKAFIEKTMFFSVLTKNLNWEMLTKNLVTFKRWVGGIAEKGSFWTVCRFKGKGGLGKEEGVFLREGLIPQCTL